MWSSPPPPPPPGDGPAWCYEWRQGRSEVYWCRLCFKYATEDHLACDQHAWRIKYPHQYVERARALPWSAGLPPAGSSPCPAAASAPQQQPQPQCQQPQPQYQQPPWYQQPQQPPWYQPTCQQQPQDWQPPQSPHPMRSQPPPPLAQPQPQQQAQQLITPQSLTALEEGMRQLQQQFEDLLQQQRLRPAVAESSQPQQDEGTSQADLQEEAHSTNQADDQCGDWSLTDPDPRPAD